MQVRTKIATTIAVAGIILAGGAAHPSLGLAWGGAQVQPLSCPEIHLSLPSEQGDWNVQARLGRVTGSTPAQRYASFVALPFALNADGSAILNRNVAGSDVEQVIGGFYLPTALPTVVTVAVGNASNLADGFTYRTSTMTNCAAPPSPAPVTITIDRTVTNTIIQQVPAPPQLCTSGRSISFLVRVRYPGVTNTDGSPVLRIDRSKVKHVNGKLVGRGAYTGLDSEGKVIVTSAQVLSAGKNAGRIRVTIKAAGHKFNPYSNDLRTTVWLETADGSYRTLYVSATCRSEQGNPNDQRARTVIIPG